MRRTAVLIDRVVQAVRVKVIKEQADGAAVGKRVKGHRAEVFRKGAADVFLQRLRIAQAGEGDRQDDIAWALCACVISISSSPSMKATGSRIVLRAAGGA